MRASAIIAENLIREAMEEGQFDDLPGAGKPIDLAEYFALPEEHRMAYTLLRNADMSGGEVALGARIERLRERLERESNPEVRDRLTALLDELEARQRP